MLPALTVLYACGGPAESPAVPPVADIDLYYADTDGDGFGDPSNSRQLSAAQSGWVSEATDCNDSDAEVFPGAPERCNAGVDDDCDGAPGPDELDGDGDGLSSCDGDCDDTRADVSPAALEVCTPVEIDDDCDGLLGLDDPDAEPYSCGWCPDAADLSAVLPTFRVWTVNPCILDSSITGCARDTGQIDLHSQGWRLHRVGHPTDIEAREELFLFLPPGPGSNNGNLLELAIFAGYRTISLGWQNVDSVADCGTDGPCYADARQELVYGDDLHPTIDVGPADSIVGRLTTLLQFLSATDPTTAWSDFLDPATGAVRFDRVVVGGWSAGAGTAAWLGKTEPIDGLVLLSGPKDLLGPETLPAWMSEPRSLPECAQFGAYHRFEDPIEIAPLVYEAFGMIGPPVDVDLVPPPFNDAQMLVTEAADPQESWCTVHQAMGMDQCMDIDALAPMYLYAMCSAAYIDACD